MQRTEDARARYIMIGGFLGAGKTTALAALGRRLADQGVRVGLISNDQSTGLVDTNLLRSQGFTVEEIAGGCFCCRFDSLLEASEKLTNAAAPEVFLAEPVGSCTDLVATVSYPLRRIYGDRFIISPLSVLVDPVRAARILGLEPGRPFSEKVAYIYKKQLEEADVIVVNKCDSISGSLRDRLVEALSVQFPKAEVFCCSVREETGLEEWLDCVLSQECDAAWTAMDVDYGLYAEGEALLGWLNCTVRVKADRPFVADTLLLDLARAIQDRLAEGQADGGEVAHLKMTFDGGDVAGRLSVVSLVRSDGEPELRESLTEDLTEGTLILNLRAEVAPAALQTAVEEVFADAERRRQLRAKMEHMESFRPGKPVPIHRMTTADS